MKIIDIKPGMVFKENDSRVTRWIRITNVVNTRIQTCIYMESSSVGPQGPWAGQSTSRAPQRFYTKKVSSGYSLITPEELKENNAKS